MPDTENPSTILPGTVEKIIKPWFPGDTEKAQISIQGADHLYREIRIENTMTDADGESVSLKKGAEVNVIIEANLEDMVAKPAETADLAKKP